MYVKLSTVIQLYSVCYQELVFIRANSSFVLIHSIFNLPLFIILITPRGLLTLPYWVGSEKLSFLIISSRTDRIVNLLECIFNSNVLVSTRYLKIKYLLWEFLKLWQRDKHQFRFKGKKSHKAKNHHTKTSHWREE